MDMLVLNLESGEYKNIDNILVYSDSIQDQLIRYYTMLYHQAIDDKVKLNLLLDEVVQLVVEYNIIYLEDIEHNIVHKISTITEEARKAEEQRMKEKILLRAKKEEKIFTDNTDDTVLWICYMCNISKPERHGSFFNDGTCLRCARAKSSSLTY